MFQKKKNQVEFSIEVYMHIYLKKINVFTLFLSQNKVCPSIYLSLFSFCYLSFVFLCIVYFFKCLAYFYSFSLFPPCYVSIIATFVHYMISRDYLQVDFFQIPIQQHCLIISLVTVGFPFILLGFLSRHNYNFVFSLPYI